MGLFSKVGKVLNDVTGVTSSRNAENRYTTEMWNAANEYNSPTSQLARMAEAGIDINPTSYALGTNNLSNTTNAVSSAHGGTAGNPISSLMGVISGAVGVASGLQYLSNMKEQNTIYHEQGINEMIRGQNLMNQGASIRINNEIARHNLAYGKKVGKPVGYVPTVYSDPVNYAGEILGDAAVDIGNTIAGW